MIPLFLYPLAFFGLAAIPALLAIYLLRNRFRRQVVSSLMLWLDTREAREGGRKLRRLQTPLFFLLELLAILLLVFAASDPQMKMTTGARPIVVVLDDSISMLAGGDQAARKIAEQELEAELKRQNPYSIRLILASERPRILGDLARSPREAMSLLEGWRCKSPTARLDDAIGLAGELGGELALILVLTDHEPSVEIPDKGRIQWWAFGKPRANLAFVNAVRTQRDGLDRCLLEICNLSSEPSSCQVIIKTLEDNKELQKRWLQLDKQETQRLVIQFPASTPAVVAQLDDGVLPADSRVILLPNQQRSIRVDLRLRDGRIREPVVKALNATQLVQYVDSAADLILTDREEEKQIGSAWVMYFRNEPDVTAFQGPFVLNRTHPLLAGISLKSAIWGASKQEKENGIPLVMAGNVPLLTVQEIPTQGGQIRYDLQCRFRPDFSTVQQTDDWPILFWNLITWRSSMLPGIARPNIRLGEQAILSLGDYTERVELQAPNALPRDLIVRGRQVSLPGEELGLHEVRLDRARFRYAVNVLNQDESDLTHATTGRWGNWLDDTTLQMEYRSIYWILLLLLLSVTIIHLLLMSGSRTWRG